MKKFVSFMISLALLGGLSAFAAPDTVSPYDKSTATDIIAVTNPEGQKEYTLDADYVISGYGKEGTVITLYWHDSTVDQYKKIYNHAERTKEDGTKETVYEEATVTVGASGLFMNTVELAEGGNNVLVRAENGGYVQYVKLSLTRGKRNLLGIIKALTN